MNILQYRVQVNLKNNTNESLYKTNKLRTQMYGHQRGEKRVGGTNILPTRDSLQGENHSHTLKVRGTGQESIAVIIKTKQTLRQRPDRKTKTLLYNDKEIYTRKEYFTY